MTVKFKKYSEIENTYNQKFINKLREHHCDDQSIKWFCFNKIDGSNFQCTIDIDDNFVVGTRNNYLTRDSEFQGWQRAMRNEDVEAKLRQIKSIIQNEYKADKFGLTVYGELCGGFYRHPDVQKVKHAVKIQGRVDYHPDDMWVPFDIIVRTIDDNNVEHYLLLKQSEVISLCEQVHLPHQQIMFEGTFDQCLNFPIDFVDTTGHDLWGLPIIENNISEGVVIKPDNPIFFPNGERVILKNKGSKYKERICKNKEKQHKDLSLNELEQKYYDILEQYITESRLYSIFSKVGQINQKSFGMILGMFIKDMINEFNKQYKEEIEKLEQDLSIDQFNFSNVRKLISKEVSDFIRPLFVNKLNED